jgi:hypothetical protein
VQNFQQFGHLHFLCLPSLSLFTFQILKHPIHL